MHVTVLNVERREVKYTGKTTGKVISKRLRAAMTNNDPWRIDAHALRGYKENAQFFVSEVHKRLESAAPAEAAPVMIVLSAPVESAKGEDLRPIEAAPVPGSGVFYIRCTSLVPWTMPLSELPMPLPSQGSLHIPAGRNPFIGGYANNRDSLERTLAPLHPRLFDVTTALEFRSALAAIMSDISQQK